MTEQTQQQQQQQQSHSILVDKVNRALQVPTDTPAMKAALEALSHLHTSAAAVHVATGTESSSCSNNVQQLPAIDSRSVRVAIEQDALQQALRLQTELRSLVATVQDLSRQVSETALIAQKVRQAANQSVLTVETPIQSLPKTTAAAAAAAAAAAVGSLDESVSADIAAPAPATGLASSTAATTTPSSSSSSASNTLAEEQKLAQQLSAAFAHRDLCRKRAAAVTAFLERFDLSQQDSRLLDHYNFEDITPSSNSSMDTVIAVNGLAFLHALERVRQIRMALGESFGSNGSGSDPMSLLSSSSISEKGERGLGASSVLRMMESLAQKQERAYERLYHWLQQYLQLFAHSASSNHGGTSSVSSSSHHREDTDGLDEALQHPFVKRSIYALRHVPAFYSHILLEVISGARRSESTRRFLLALTSGYEGFPPIEMKAHDPVAYIGDMLAFSFKTFSSEMDLAKGLLEYLPEEEEEGERKSENEPEVDDVEEDHCDPSTDSSIIEKPVSTYEMLSTSMSGLARPLKSRILQVVASLARRPNEEDNESDDGLADDFEEEGSVVRNRITHLYEICGLLLFYMSVIEKGLQKLAPSSASDEDVSLKLPENPLVACLLDCISETTMAYEATARAYGAMLDQVSSITGDTEAHQVKSMLNLIGEVRLTSPGFSNDVSCPEDCKTILSTEWITITLVSAALSCSATLDDVLMLKQSVHDLQQAGLSIVAFEKLVESIGEKEFYLVEQLVTAEQKKVLEVCGLAPIVSAWQRWQQVKDDGTFMSGYPGLSQDEVEACMKSFSASLFSPPIPSLETAVKDPQLRKSARSKIATHVCNVYEKLHDSIVSESGGYDDLSFLVHSPEQVITLFSA